MGNGKSSDQSGQRPGRVLTPLDVEQDLADTLAARAYIQGQYSRFLDPDMPLRYEPPVRDETDKEPVSTEPKFFFSSTTGRVRQDRQPKPSKRFGRR